MNWVELNYKQEPTTKTKVLLNRHSVFISGFDRQLRPVVCLDLTTQDYEPSAILEAFVCLSFLVREYIHVPGYVEQSVLLINLNEMPVIEVSYCLKGLLELIEN